MRRDIAFDAEGTTLRGWLYLPDGAGPHATVVMAHGFTAVKEQHLDRYAEVFAAAGLAALVFDNRNFGASDGEPRQEADPVQQIRDYRHAITYARTLPERRARPRARCDRPACALRGDAGAEDPVAPCAIAGVEAWTSFTATRDLAPAWRNEVTLRSVEMLREYEPGTWVARISPTPVLMVVATHDTLTPTDLALDAYNRALEPKGLVLIPGGHFEPYTGAGFGASSTAARDWFARHLL